jgi:hypothetical protein
MGYERQKSFNVHDPLGLIAMPMAPMTAELENSVADYPKLITDSGQSTGVPTAVKTIGGALITALVLVGLVALRGPATERTGTSQSYAAWCHI